MTEPADWWWLEEQLQQQQQEPEIVATFTGAAIPVRGLDWTACRDGEQGEATALRGYGATRQEAIDNLIDLENAQ